MSQANDPLQPDNNQDASKDGSAQARHPSIDQIEQLQLPKRAEKRRPVYLGEHIQVWLNVAKGRVLTDVIDLSPQGLALVDLAENKKLSLALGQKVTLEFARGSADSFVIGGEVSNLSTLWFAETEYLRTGIRFLSRSCHSLEEYLGSIPDKLITCHGGIRPQAFCADPFFFQEVLILQVVGIGPRGLDLQVSARCKTLLPQLPFELQCHVPGRGQFCVKVKNSDLYFRMASGDFRLYATFIQPEKSQPEKGLSGKAGKADAKTPAQFESTATLKAFLEALSEYIVLFTASFPPNRLRSLGFTVGDLSHAFIIEATPVKSVVFKKANLQPSLLAPPLSGQESADAEEGGEALTPFTRRLYCKLGPHFVAVAGLVFVLGDPSKSALQGSLPRIRPELMAEKHVELVGLYLSPDIMLVDILLPLLQNIVRIAVQARARFLLLECGETLRPVLLKMGFTDSGSKVQRTVQGAKTQTFCLLELAISKAMQNQQNVIPQLVWQKVYKGVFEFFKKKWQQQKNTQ